MIDLEKGDFYQGPWTDLRTWSAATDEPDERPAAAPVQQFSPAFNRAFERVVGHEGGYVNDPRDNGGETKYGISKRAHPHVDIKNLTLDQAKAIYHQNYWLRVGAEMFPAGIAYALFDAAVNAGPSRAIKWMQRAVRTAPDGIIGPGTRRAVALAMRNPAGVLGDMLAYRNVHNSQTGQMDVYGLGWSRRLFDVYATAMTLSGEGNA